MATLIQSKQIEGIVTSSVIHGEFLVSGSLTVTGSNSILGSVTASTISSSFIGDGSGITDINYSQIGDTPQFIGGTNITITSSSNEITVHATLDGTGSDVQNLSITGDQLTILGGNTITIPTGSGVSDYNQLTNVPSGIVSSSDQILGGTTILSGSRTDISNLNIFTASIQTEVDGISAVTSSYLTELPSGTVSGSDQILGNTTILSGSHYTDSDVKTKLDIEGVISGSEQVLGGTGILSGSYTDISSLNTFTSSYYTDSASLDTRITTEKSRIDNILSGSNADYDQFVEIVNLVNTTDTENDTAFANHYTSSRQRNASLEQFTSSIDSTIKTKLDGDGVISGSSQITITESQISDLDKYTDADVQSYINSSGIVSGSVIAELPDGTVSGSSQITDGSGILSGSKTDITDLNTFTSSIQTEVDGLSAVTSSYLTEVPDGTISGSSQITITESQISDLDKYNDSDVKTKLDSESVVSGSSQVVLSNTDGFASFSSSIDTSISTEKNRIDAILDSAGADTDTFAEIVTLINQVDTTNDNAFATHYTSSRQRNTSLEAFTSSIQTEVDGLSAVTSSYLSELPNGVISGSSQVTITESQISDLTHYTDSDVKTKLDAESVISGSSQVVSSLPDGTVSGSSQITITESQISDLTHYGDSDVKTKLDADGVISGSSQITDNSGIVSGSSQTDRTWEISISGSVVSGSLTGSFGFQGAGLTSTEYLPTLYLTRGETYNFDNTTSHNLRIQTNTSGQESSSLYSDGIAGNNTIDTLSWNVQFDSPNKLYYQLQVPPYKGGVIYVNDSFTDGENLVSGSSQVENLLTETTFSSSVDTRLDGLEGGAALYYDVSNTVWNGKFIRGGSKYYSDSSVWNTNGNENLFTFTLNSDAKLNYNENDIVYISNFDRDVRLAASPITGSDSYYYNTSSREITFEVLEINGDASDTIQQINDSYWIITKQSSGFVQLNDYLLDSASFDSRIEETRDELFATASDHETRLLSHSSSISDHEGRITVIETTYATTASLDEVSSSLDSKIDDVFESQSIAVRNAFSSSIQVDFREVTNYVSDEHIDHTTVNINAGDGLDGGGDIASSREIRLNVTSSHFEEGVKDVLDSEGVVKQSTLNTDLISTDFSQSVDNRINGISGDSQGANWNTNLQNIPTGLVSASSQIDIEQTENYTAFSSSIATSISNVDTSTIDTGSFATTGSNVFVANQIVSGSIIPEATADGNGIHDLGTQQDPWRELYITTGSVNFVRDGELVSKVSGEKDAIRVGNILITTSSLQIVSGSGDNITTISTIASADVAADGQVSNAQQLLLPDGTVSGSDQVLGNTGIFSGSFVGGTNVTITSGSGIITISSSDVSGSDATDISALNTFTSSADTRITNLESFSSSLDADFATDTEVTNLSSSLSQSIYEAAQSGSGVSSWNELSDVPSGLLSGSAQIASDISGSFTSVSESLDTRIITEKERIDNILSGANADYDQFVEIVDLVNSTDTENDTAFANHYTSSRQRMDSLESFTGSLDATFATDSEVTNLSSSLSQSIYEAAQSGSGISSWTELNDIPSGLISSSEQLPSGVISGSTQITDGSNLVSGSVLRTLDGTDVVSGSVLRTLDGTTVLSGSIVDQLPSGVISGSEQLPSGLVSSSFVAGTNVTLNQEGDVLYISASGGSSDVTYDGDRTISNDKLGDLFTDSVNPGTSGSIQEFLNAVFYPNTGPSISSGNQTIAEYVTSGTTITTLSGTDPEGQAITFGTASLYTDDLVRVASNGVMTLNALAESSSFNTDLTGGSHGHQVTVTATDTFGTTTEKDIYIFVTPNSTPVFRETSTSGNVITSVTANLNENSTDDTLVKRVYFTDANGDDITIYSSSIDNNHFDVTKYSTYVDIRQNTGSLDYEQQTSYTFSISASDEHYESSEDSDSIVGLPITINVTDNLVPTLSDQTLSSINENSSNGATVGSISATDNEGDTITFKNFELHQLQLDDSVVSSGSYSGTAQLTDPHENPFQMSSSGIVTRKTGVYLNSDLINEYIYRVQITDAYNNDSAVSLITINVTDDTPATLSDNWSAGPYIKESEESGTTIKTTDYGSTAADYGSDQSGTWSSSNSAISINSNGTLSLGVDLSGSVTQSGDTLDSTITFTNTFGTTTTDSLSLTIVANGVPTATFSNQSSVFNSNEATNGTNLVSISISDTESDTPYQLSIGGTDASKLNAVPQNAASSSWELQASEDLSGGTYTYDVTVTDNYSKSTTYSSRTITIAQGDTGTLGGDTTSYIIESAENGDSLRDATGFGSGNTSQLSVSYTDYGSPSVQSYTSSNEAFDIDTSGNITLGLDISGSSTGSGDTLSSDITFVDQFGNIGSGSLTVNVFANGAPTADFSNSGLTGNYNENLATSGTTLLSSTITDTEGDTPYSMSLSGTSAWAIQAVPQNSDSSSYQIQVTDDTSSLAAGTYTYDVEVTDNFGKSTTYSNRTFEIAAADDGDLVSTDAYIIESARNGDLIRRNSDGTSGTQSSVAVSYSPSYGSPVATNFASSNALIDIDSSGRLSVGNDISGSGNVNGSLIATTISWNDQYGNNGSEAISVDVTQNFAPTVSSTNTFNENTNQATGSSEIVRLNLTDTESDSIPNGSVSFSGYNTTYFIPSISTPQMKLLANSTSIPAGTYPYTASLQDEHGFSTTVHSGSVTISQADDGTLGGDTTSYIIESAESGDVLRDATGYNNGNPSQLSVSYSPSYGSPSVQTYSSSNPAIVVDSSGNLTLGVDISGSVTQSGDTISSTITFTDEYGNSDTDTITATVFGNSAPAASFTATSDYDSDASVSGSTAGTLTVTDTENNSPFTFTLAGTDGDKFNVAGSSSPFTVQPTGSLDAGTYSVNITVTDNYNESVTLTNETITVDAAEVLTKVYIYTSTRTGGGTLGNANYNGILGITSEDTTTTPDTITGFQSAGPSPMYEFKDGHLGDSSISVGGGTLTLRAERSGSNLDTIISSSFNGDGSTAEQIMILFPSGSTLGGIPTSMTDSLGGSTDGEYALYLKAAGEAGFNAAGTQIHQFDVDSDVDGYGTWNIIGRNSTNTAASYELRMIPSSGSAPS